VEEFRGTRLRTRLYQSLHSDPATSEQNDPQAVEKKIANDAENLQFRAVFLTHSPVGTTVPRLANPDQNQGARKRSSFPPSFVSPAVE
jgi:hypothetical protein